jgi:hypothetical protein
MKTETHVSPFKTFSGPVDTSQTRRKTRAALLVAAAALSLFASSAHAQWTADSETTPEKPQPEMQPEAVAALDNVGAYLRTLQRFRIDADSVTDAVLSTGQNVGFLHHTELQVQRPDKVRVLVSGNRAPKGMVYDGRTFVLFNDADHYYSQVPAPPTIAELIDDADRKYGVGLPLADLFYWGEHPDDDEALTTAVFVGLDKVDGKSCNHYAYQQPGLDWELWTQTGPRPLPCRFVVTDTTQPSRPRHAIDYHWTLDPKFAPSTFVFRPAPGAQKIELRPAGVAIGDNGGAQ